MWDAGYDGYRIAQVYGDKFIPWEIARVQNYEVVHVHFFFDMVMKLLNTDARKLILQYHGSDIVLSNSSPLDHIDAQIVADNVLVARDDLLEYVPSSTVLPIPVDTELFNDTNYAPDLDLLSWDNLHVAPVRHAKLPGKLKRYKKFHDLRQKGGYLVKANTTTGLQALACGLEVINFAGDSLKGLPDKHLAYNVVRQLEMIYQ